MALQELESFTVPSGFAVKMESAWKNFIETGEVDSSVVRPIIAESWRRSREIGLDPYDRKCFTRLSDAELELRLKANKELIDTASPFMNLLYKAVAGSGFRVDLTDNEGYLLKVMGDESILDEAELLQFLPGANRQESRVGTCGISLALANDMPIQVAGAEHYNFHIHRWTCSSAPIHDSTGRMVGVLNVTGHCSLVHKHTLGMVIAAVEAIERQFILKNLASDLGAMNEFLKTVISSINDGIIVLDNRSVITHFNCVAAKILQCSPEEVVGRTAREVSSLHPELQEVLGTPHGYEVQDKEISIRGKRGSTRCFVSVKRIRCGPDHMVGTLITISKMDRVRKLVHHLVGAHAQYTFDDIVSEDEEFKEALNLAKICATTSSKVLLQGESGTGKELIAQAIHNASLRRDGPFVAVNCAAVPRDLIESELFGYEEGAFTGARKGGKPGKFELAEGGTLFLDEVESMPLEMQAKLLRVIEDGQVVRVGGSEIIPVNVRIIAATNQDLATEVKNGNFREDLFYRLNVITINIPPLRKRRVDIPLLVEHFLKKASKRVGKSVAGIQREALDYLCDYPYPGNVRELENIVERALLVSEGSTIELKHLPDKVKRVAARPEACTSGTCGGQPASLHELASSANGEVRAPEARGLYQPPVISLDVLEKMAILEALKTTGGNISRTARILGIGRNTLYRRLRKYGMSESMQHCADMAQLCATAGQTCATVVHHPVDSRRSKHGGDPPNDHCQGV